MIQQHAVGNIPQSKDVRQGKACAVEGVGPNVLDSNPLVRCQSRYAKAKLLSVRVKIMSPDS